MAKQGKIMGPVDYLTLRFPGNKFSGKIAPELVDLEKKGIIRVIDLVFLMKDAKGKLVTIEAKNLEGEAGAAFRELAKHTDEWFSEGDIEALATSIPKNSSRALLLFENLWAVRFRDALVDADAELVGFDRIPPETMAKAEKKVKAKGGA